MTAVHSGPTPGGPDDPASPPLLIDVDVHEIMRSGRDLLPYLDEKWHPFLEHPAYHGFKVPDSFPAYPLYGGLRQDWRDDRGLAGTDPEVVARDLFEAEGVTTAILNGFFYPSTLPNNYEFARALASAYNDWQIAMWLDRDARFKGSIQVVAHDPQLAAEEIDRVAEHPRIVQVFLPLVAERQYGEPMYHPIFEAAARNKLAVAFHHSSATSTLFGYPRYYIEWHTVAAPVAAMHQIMSLIFGGVFDSFPDLKVVVLESGVAWVPWLMWRLDEQFRQARREVPWVKQLPSEHMLANVRVATQPLGDVKTKFQQVVEMSGTESVFLFASDYPHYDADLPADVLLGRLPEDLRARLMWRNALETFPRLAHLAK